jgi:hypothetical protein
VIQPSVGPADPQLPLWPKPLSLPEQLLLPEPIPQGRAEGDDGPLQVSELEPPEAPAALECVANVLVEVCATLRVTVPRVRWYEALPGMDPEDSWEGTLGFVRFGESVVWLCVDYVSPQGLASTVAHEAVHYWQGHRRGRCLDGVEHAEREGEARRRADLMVPKGTYRTPRGKKRDRWFEPARRRYG